MPLPKPVNAEQLIRASIPRALCVERWLRRLDLPAVRCDPRWAPLDWVGESRWAARSPEISGCVIKLTGKVGLLDAKSGPSECRLWSVLMSPSLGVVETRTTGRPPVRAVVTDDRARY